VRRSRQFPYQFFAAHQNAGAGIPSSVRAALGRAAEAACGNVPELSAPVVIGVDVSGSMSSSVVGARGRGTPTKVRCVDVAALFAVAIRRRNPESVIIPFDTQAYNFEPDAEQSVLQVAATLARYGGGGTNCSLPLLAARQRFPTRPFAGCVLLSDNESWVGTGRYGTTAVLTEWEQFRGNQRALAAGVSDPRLVCIDLQAYTTTQAPDRADILNVGGFSDAVFDVVAGFLDSDRDFVKEVEAVEL